MIKIETPIERMELSWSGCFIYLIYKILFKNNFHKVFTDIKWY